MAHSASLDRRYLATCLSQKAVSMAFRAVCSHFGDYCPRLLNFSNRMSVPSYEAIECNGVAFYMVFTRISYLKPEYLPMQGASGEDMNAATESAMPTSQCCSIVTMSLSCFFRDLI